MENLVLIILVAILLESKACRDHDPCDNESSCPPGFQGANCTIRTKCNGVVLEGDAANIARATIITGAVEVNNGEIAVVECLLDDNTKINKTMFCALNSTTGEYNLQGDRPLCSVSDCGSLLDISGSSQPILSTTTVGSMFNFTCDENHTRVGSVNNTHGNILVVCERTGRWNYGDLSCIPTACFDPGTPTDAYQITEGYNVGQAVKYVCKRDGYSPHPDPILICIRDENGNVKWNGVMPLCIDTVPPVFKNCPEDTVRGQFMESLRFSPPSATDNSGFVMVSASDDFSGTIVFNGEKSVTFTARDGANNTAQCSVRFEIEYLQLRCPEILPMEFPFRGETAVLDISPFVFSNGKFSLYPSNTVTVNEESIGSYFDITVVAGLGEQFALCRFQVHITSRKCIQTNFRNLTNANRECYTDEKKVQHCNNTCRKDTFLPNGKTSVSYTCRGNNDWKPAENINQDCFSDCSANGNCTSCTSSQYLHRGLTNTQCKSCPNNTISVLPRLDIADCQAVCVIGFVSETSLPPCTACPLNTYAVSATRCEPCPKGTSTGRVRGATDVQLCEKPCEEGKYSASGYGECEACPKNFYSNPQDKRVCLECPTDKVTMDSGSSKASDCVDGIDLCNRITCLNGVCEIKSHQPFCSCNIGYTGVKCEASIDYCSSSPCLNGGSCTVTPTEFKCSCIIGFIGEVCQIDTVNNCPKGRCSRNGFCQDGINNSTCICINKNGADSRCEIQVDLCNGTCERGECVQFGNTRAHCICPPDYTGERCEREINQCDQNPTACLNDGICVNAIGEEKLSCICRDGYNGTRCEIHPVCPEVTTQPPTIEDLCDGFTIIGNFGVKELEECDKRRVCFLRNNETIRRTIRCPYGTFWNQTLRKCDNISDVDCPNDPCGNLCSYKTNGKCYQYYICEDGKTKVASCPYGQSYPPGENQHCQYNSSCEHPGEPCSYPYIRSYKNGGKCYEFYQCVNGEKQKKVCPNMKSYPSGLNKRCVVNYGCRRFPTNPYDPCRNRYLRSYKKSGKCYEYYQCKSGRSRKVYCPNRMYYPVGSNNRCMRSRRCKRKSWFNGSLSSSLEH